MSASPASRPVAVITGASSGIGEVFARALARDYDLVLIARRKDRLETVAAAISGAGSARVEILVADLTEESGLAAAADRITAEKNLGLLVNNAGFGARGLFWETPLESHHRMYRLHIAATVRLAHAALRNLVPKNRGAVINVASVAGFFRGIGNNSYCATKGWMVAFTEGLHLDLKSVNSAVVVQALCPGFTFSEFHDTMKADRWKLAPRSFWLAPEKVVNESLAALRGGRLFVIPGWHYRLLVGLMTKLPVGLRLALESRRK